MGNGYAKHKLTLCFCGHPPRRRRIGSAAVTSEPFDDGLGHSFRYISSKIQQNLDNSNTTSSTSTATSSTSATTSFSLSGASISANTSTQLSTSLDLSSLSSSSAAFNSSSSFSSMPLHPIPRSASLDPSSAFLSGPLHPNPSSSSSLRRSFSHGARLIRTISKSITTRTHDDVSKETGLFEWAHGRAGEDRVHVVVDKPWLFVGIYDGFNGPDATDYLLSNLYSAVRKELPRSADSPSPSEVLEALSAALRATEEDYLDIADRTVSENPELALMGSCVLAMLMKGEDVYIMSVGDSRAVMGSVGKARKDLERISEDYDCGGDRTDLLSNLVALQLTSDHSTCIQEEVRRIRSEHPDDACAVLNNRVKGSLKVTRAFGAGFLKQPKWNNALLEMFRIDYVGTSPYITCNPFLYHHRLGPKDSFLILSSDGLYQYFTNDEAVSQVELFIATNPEGDPAQHLVEEVLHRAAKEAGLDFHDLLEIPQGDRRRYHDDVSIIIISFEGRIWKSCM